MEVRLLGTGSADRLPNPWCRCPRCAAARASGEQRDRTSALVDGTLLIDPGPDLGARAVDLSRVRTVLISHGHPDHLDPAFLLAWAWAGESPLVVVGPADAVAACRPWVGPDAPIEFRSLRSGDELEAQGPAGSSTLRVRALPAAHSTRAGRDHDGTALLYEVSGPDGRMLYGTDTAALPHDLLADRYDLVLLECTFGDWAGHGTAHLDLPAFGHEVAALRSAGRLAPDARVVAVHLSHHTPADLAGRLAGVGAEVVADGTVIRVGAAAGAGRRLFITGGARSGKSARAEAVLAGSRRAGRAVIYVATAPEHPDDSEWVARVARHRARRPSHWETIEGDAAADLAAILGTALPGSSVLVDCLTLWLTGLIDAAQAWEDPDRATAVADEATARLAATLATTRADVVLVSNEVGAGVVPATSSGRLFRDLLGRLNAAVAAACDDVELVTCGIAMPLKGRTWTTT